MDTEPTYLDAIVCELRDYLLPLEDDGLLGAGSLTSCDVARPVFVLVEGGTFCGVSVVCTTFIPIAAATVISANFPMAPLL